MSNRDDWYAREEEARRAREEEVLEVGDWAKRSRRVSRLPGFKHAGQSSLTPRLVRKALRDAPRVLRHDRPLWKQQKRHPLLLSPTVRLLCDAPQLRRKGGAVLVPLALEEGEPEEVAGPTDDGDATQRGFERDVQSG